MPRSSGETGTVALRVHSQQAAEKAAKAFLTFHQVPFRKTHSLPDLGSQCASVDPSLEEILRESRILPTTRPPSAPPKDPTWFNQVQSIQPHGRGGDFLLLFLKMDVLPPEDREGFMMMTFIALGAGLAVGGPGCGHSPPF